MNNEKWYCNRCGKEESTREGRRKHRKCPLPQMERFQRAMAFQDPAFVEELQKEALEGNAHSRRLLLQKPEADRDFALYQKMYNYEQERRRKLGLRMDGRPIDEEITTTTPNDEEITDER